MRSNRGWRLTAATFGLASLMFTVGALGIRNGAGSAPGVAAPEAVRAAPGDVDGTIRVLRLRVERFPDDEDAWATLGLAFVDKAKATFDPTFYGKARAAFERSLKIDRNDNFLAALGMSSMNAALHRFPTAKIWADRGLAINPSHAPLYGALADAETQLGNYMAGFQAVQRMLDLNPDSGALARASYAWELRGDVEQARNLMERALTAASSPAQKVFARYFLGELALNTNDPAGALRHYEAGLRDVPRDGSLLEGRAKAKVALGDPDGALEDFAASVSNGSEPAYLLEYGELLESLGRQEEALKQYRRFESQVKLFEANGEAPDVDAALYFADHGDPAKALKLAERALRTRPFSEMQDAYAWTLHRNGRTAEAQEWSDKSLSLGGRHAISEFHAAEIAKALGNLDVARIRYQKALAINPSFHPIHARTARAALDALAT